MLSPKHIYTIPLKLSEHYRKKKAEKFKSQRMETGMQNTTFCSIHGHCDRQLSTIVDGYTGFIQKQAHQKPDLDSGGPQNLTTHG